MSTYANLGPPPTYGAGVGVGSGPTQSGILLEHAQTIRNNIEYGNYRFFSSNYPTSADYRIVDWIPHSANSKYDKETAKMIIAKFKDEFPDVNLEFHIRYTNKSDGEGEKDRTFICVHKDDVGSVVDRYKKQIGEMSQCIDVMTNEIANLNDQINKLHTKDKRRKNQTVDLKGTKSYTLMFMLLGAYFVNPMFFWFIVTGLGYFKYKDQREFLI